MIKMVEENQPIVEEKQKEEKPVEIVKEEVKIDEVPNDNVDNIDEKKKDDSIGNDKSDKVSGSSTDDKGKPGDREDKSKSKAIEDTKKEEEKPKDERKKIVNTGPKKTEAVVNGKDLRISTKHSVAVCNFIRNKDVDIAIKELGEVSNKKRAIPMKGEIPHRKGMMSGRYPVTAVNEFIKLLKSVKANAIMNELELEKVKIFCKANIASRPRTRFGQGKHKRSHVQIKLVPMGKK
jgi:ribosomal protein L22